jgi:DNA-directed RNA polymerase subunit RPC12/RpoP
MGREIIYRCDKCGVWINKTDVDRNGQGECTQFTMSNNADGSLVFMCRKCWAEFEKVYREFMGAKEQSK